MNRHPDLWRSSCHSSIVGVSGVESFDRKVRTITRMQPSLHCVRRPIQKTARSEPPFEHLRVEVLTIFMLDIHDLDDGLGEMALKSFAGTVPAFKNIRELDFWW